MTPAPLFDRSPCSVGHHRRGVRLAGLSLALIVWAHTSGNIPIADGQESFASKIARENLSTLATLVAVDSNDQPLALGSGFFITRDGALATNAHVVEGAARVIIRWRGQTGSGKAILRFDSRYDVITLQTSFSSTPAVSLGDSELVTVGQDVVALGSPQGLEGTVSTGIISGVRDLGGIKVLQISAPISPGSSGGPIFNTQGRVIGIATASLMQGQNLNFAIPVNLLRELPSTTITFAAVKHAFADRGLEQNMHELVFADNIIEHFAFGFGNSGLSSLTVSLQNRTNNTIGAFKILIVVKNPDGGVLNFQLTDLKDTVIPPGLAKQVTLPAAAEGFTVYRDNKWQKGSYEIRILDFRILRKGGGAVEELFKSR